MKRILLLTLFVSVAFAVHAQRQKKQVIEAGPIVDGKMAGYFPVDETGKINYSNVVTLDSTVKKEELYWRAKNFFFENMKSGKNVIQYEDKEEGIIAGKATAEYTWIFLVNLNEVELHIPIKIQVKDGKYRYELTGITLDERYADVNEEEQSLERYSVNKFKKKSMVKADEVLRTVTQLLETSMKKPSKKKDW